MTTSASRSVAALGRGGNGLPIDGLMKQLAMVGLTILTLYPLAWLVGASFKPAGEIFTTVSPIPVTFILANYVEGWSWGGSSFGIPMLYSLLLAGLVAFGTMASCALAAYGFARLRFRGKAVLFAVMLATIMLPSQATLIPKYVLFFWMGWAESIAPLVAPHYFAVDGFFIFLMVQFVRGIPLELEEAATIDGCGRVQIFFHIILPLMRAPLITTGVLSFIWTYDDFFGQLIYLSSGEQKTVPVALSGFLDTISGDSSYGPMLAMSVVALLPVLVMFALAQRRIVESVATSGLK